MTTSGMQGYRTTFRRMFTPQAESVDLIEAVAIPLIQRDYAQGRETPKANKVRGTFLDALRDALTNSSPVGLDFIFGKATAGVFEPLDGQQRLTTLFLLHWYLAQRTGNLNASEPWTRALSLDTDALGSRFTYSTRPGARLFCERLVANPPGTDETRRPSEWAEDQPWFLHVWQFDPTIHAMLVTLDAIHDRIATDDHEALWKRLTDEEQPSIWFHLLPIDDMGSPEDLYIKMNSRGKTLTDFEAFKAHLGDLIEKVCHDAADSDVPTVLREFGHRIDGVWTDLFWPYRGDNNIVDEEMMRWFDFLLDVCEWREDRASESGSLTHEQRASALLGTDNARRLEHGAFLCRALDCWGASDTSIDHVFAGLFSLEPAANRVRLFGAASTNLFQTACDQYGALRGRVRLFSLTDTLLLYAVLVSRLHTTDDPTARLRVLRNANEASEFELRLSKMPALLSEVDAFMQTGDLGVLTNFNTNQINEEVLKRTFLTSNAGLNDSVRRLEDHDILRGTLASFELDETLGDRAAAFEVVIEPEQWETLTGALLAFGEYQRDYKDSDYHRFGSPTTERVWRHVLVDRGDRRAMGTTRTVLGKLLDRVTESPGNVADVLFDVSAEFLAGREAAGHRDWRYYLVRYPEMRAGNSGIYYGSGQRLGYELTMLRRKVQSSWYRDPYLYAIWSEAGRPDQVKDPWFYGYSTAPRWMLLPTSATEIRCLPEGLAIRTQAQGQRLTVLAEICLAAGAVQVDDRWVLGMQQVDIGGTLIDTVDRVKSGAALVSSMISAGL